MLALPASLYAQEAGVSEQPFFVNVPSLQPSFGFKI
jgi:hypothetical protein